MSVPAAWKSSIASAPSKIVIKLDFLKPFEGHNTAEFTMLPQGDAHRCHMGDVWPGAFMSKVMQVFMNLDQMIGKDFEIGLANLKSSPKSNRYPKHPSPKEQAMQVNPYLFYNGNCEAAFKFYEKVLGGKIDDAADVTRRRRTRCRARRSGRRRSCMRGCRSTARC